MGQFRLKKSVIAVSMALAAAPLAYAQQQDSGKQGDSNKDSGVQRVVVTGSNIKRVDTETSSPVQLVTREEIERSGASTVKDVLDNLASNDGNAISDLGGANSWASGASGVSLRNMGTSATLVLVNGRRVSSYGFADGLQSNFVNIDAIPANIIERIEILKDGASAVYGSEAIAGVVNIITRRDFKGGRVYASAQQSTKHSFLAKNQLASVTGGIGDMDSDGYNAYAHLELFHRGSYKDSDVRPLLPDWYVQVNPTRGTQSTGSFPGNYVGRYPDDYHDADLAGQSIFQAAPGCAPENLRNNICYYDYWKDSDAMPPADRITFLSAGRKKLNDDLTIFGEVQYANTKSTYHTAVRRSSVTGTPLTWYDSRTGQMQSFVDPQLPVGHAANPFDIPIGLNYRFTDNPDMFKNVATASQYRAMVGMEGHAFGWDFDTAIGTMGAHAQQRQQGAMDRYGYYDAIVNGEYKFGQKNPQALLDKMFPEYGSHGTYRQSFFDLKGSRALMDLGGGPLQLATGVELRHESFEHSSSDNVLDARIVQFSGVSIQGSRKTVAAFAELSAPFTKELEVNFALRGDKAINGFGAVVPKLGVAYKPTSVLMLRGTVAEGFRAPSLPETGNGGASWFNNYQLDPKRCDIATQMSDILAKGSASDQAYKDTAYALGCSVSFPSAVTPNPGLKPERSNSLTLGLVLQATDNINLTVDYYNIRRNNEIAVRGIDEILGQEDAVPGLVQRGSLTPLDLEIARRVKAISGQDIGFTVGPIASIAAQYQNISRTRVSGIDLDVKGKWKLGDWGKLDANIEGVYQIDVKGWDAAEQKYSENYVGRRGVPRVRAVGKLGWERDNWAVGTRVNYTAGTTLAWGDLDSANTIEGCAKRKITETQCHIDSDTTVDVWLKYSPFKNTTLGMNVFNVFDRGPVVVMVPDRPVPTRGRVAKVWAEYTF